MKYCYIVSCSISGGEAIFEINRDSLLETRTQFVALQEYIRKENPNLKNIAIKNLIKLDNK